LPSGMVACESRATAPTPPRRRRLRAVPRVRRARGTRAGASTHGPPNAQSSVRDRAVIGDSSGRIRVMSTVIIRDLDSLKRSLAPLLTRARKAIVFGSAARGDADEWSDLDLVIVTDTSRPFLERYLDFVAIYDVWPRLDLLIYTPAVAPGLNDLGFAEVGVREGYHAQACFGRS